MHTEASGGALKAKREASGGTKCHLKFKKCFQFLPFLFVSIQKHSPSLILVPGSDSYMGLNLDSSLRKIINRLVRLLTGLSTEGHSYHKS